MQNDLILRADAAKEIGSGHVMRCLALAQAWQDRGGRAIFVTYCESEALKQRIYQEGFKVIPVESPHPNPSDLQQILKIIDNNTRNLSRGSQEKSKDVSPWLVLDSYHFDPNYQQALQKAGCRLLVIDDLHDFSDYYVDILLNQNLNAEFLKYNSHQNARLLLGVKYILLRREFLKYQTFTRTIPETAHKILITLGGADTEDTTSKVLQVLCSHSLSNLEIKIVVGPVNQRIEAYKATLKNFPSKTHLMSNVDNMPELLAWADLAIICAGGTMWESFFMGCPTVSFAVNQVQNDILQWLHEQSVVYYAGYVAETQNKDLENSIAALISSETLRTELSKNGRALVDGKGVSTVIDHMIAFGGLYG